MKIKNIPKDISEYLEYDITSPSFLRWKKLSKYTSTAKVGDSAGTLHSHGYYTCCVKQKSMLCHRIVFFLHNGYCPDILDHIDGNRQNNNINNLREATSSQNTWNQKLSKRNTSGIKGITTWAHTKYPDIEYWRCRIVVNGKEKVRHYRKTKYTMDECISFMKNMRLNIHKEYTNHG